MSCTQGRLRRVGQYLWGRTTRPSCHSRTSWSPARCRRPKSFSRHCPICRWSAAAILICKITWSTQLRLRSETAGSNLSGWGEWCLAIPNCPSIRLRLASLHVKKSAGRLAIVRRRLAVGSFLDAIRWIYFANSCLNRRLYVRGNGHEALPQHGFAGYNRSSERMAQCVS